MTRPLFEHLDELVETFAGSTPIWLGTDFDGTLTHHQDDPTTVCLPDEMRVKLDRIAGHSRFAVAVVSGRSLSDLLPRVGMANLAYAGNHGMEIEAPGLSWVDPEALSHTDVLTAFAEEVRDFLRAVPGATIENKRLSLAINYRPCSPAMRQGIVGRLNSMVAQFPSLRLRHAPLGSEVLPESGANKGTAVKVLRDHQLGGEGIAIYLGDDLTDEDAFRAFPDAVTIHVGGRETAARFRVKSADSVSVFFDWLVRVTKHS